MKSLSTIKFDCDRTCPQFEREENGLFMCRFRPLLDNIGPTKVHSHVAKLDLNVTDLDQLEAAVKRLGLVLKRGQKTYRWWGYSVGDYKLPEGYTKDMLGKCDHAISVPGDSRAYEIGVIARKDGSGYDLLWDFYAGGYGMAEKVGGNNCEKLVEEYLYAATEINAQNLGWQYERQGDGSLLVYHPQGGTLTLNRQGEVETQGFKGGACHQAREALGLQVDPNTIVNTAECGHIPAVISIQE